jgi:glutamate formiminotransferase/formiminotetrahydrofolate cyclodeaminase
VAVGARRQIINFNWNLDTHDMAAGKDIAKRLRASGGGLPSVRAKEIDLAARKQVQISTVLTDYKLTSMKRVITECAKLAGEHKAKIKTTEIVGLLPREALVDFAIETLTLENFNPEVQILENRLEAVGALGGVGWQKAAETVAEALANTDATPGGGSAAGIAGAMGCGLGLMAVGISLKSKKLEEGKRPGLEVARGVLGRLKAEFQRLTAADAASFDVFMAAAALPKDDPARPTKMQEALLHAAEVPLETTAKAVEAHKAVREALSLTGAAVTSDMNCALHLLKAAGLCAAENVRINLSGMKDQPKARELDIRLASVLQGFGGS